MKAFLLYRDADLDLKQKLPPQEPALTQDLELHTLLDAMARGDKFLWEVAQKAVLFSVTDLDTIRYRQDILKDCLKNPAIVRDMYALVVGAIENEKKPYTSIFSRYPGSILYSAIEVLQMFVVMLKRLRAVADEHSARFESEGFRTLLAMLQRELSDDYFASVQDHLIELKFRDGVLISAELGQGNKGIHYVLRQAMDGNPGWMRRFFAKKPPAYSLFISDRDESGARALTELRDQGINLVANALAQSMEHILSFFTMLRIELGFYVGCLNLYDRLIQLGEPVCFPLPLPAGARGHSFTGLYDVCLALTLQQRIVGNDLNLDQRDLVIITGANQGGKSTFLRSIGLAQLMLQCGMFVPAEKFAANVCDGLFTHYKREEDSAMNSGKLDEELHRMSEIVDRLAPDALVLFNESFAATNEREGSEIARQIIRALLEKGVKVFCVTHMYELAHGFYEQQLPGAVFLRAERQSDGVRSYKLSVGEPLPTSFGADLYARIFGDDAVLGR